MFSFSVTHNLKLDLGPIAEEETPWMFLDKSGKHAYGFMNKGGTWNYRLFLDFLAVWIIKNTTNRFTK